MQLLDSEKDALSPASYAKYLEAGTILFEQDHDHYLISAIMSKYVRISHNSEANGGKKLSLDVVVDMIHYFSNSEKVKSLYLVKLIKMLWYADALSYKRRGHAISGLVYYALPMGAVPVGYNSIMDLKGIPYEEEDIGEMSAYHFYLKNGESYPALTDEDKKVLDKVIEKLGRVSKREIVDFMHQERAYIETKPKDMIRKSKRRGKQ